MRTKIGKEKAVWMTGKIIKKKKKTVTVCQVDFICSVDDQESPINSLTVE